MYKLTKKKVKPTAKRKKAKVKKNKKAVVRKMAIKAY